MVGTARCAVRTPQRSVPTILQRAINRSAELGTSTRIETRRELMTYHPSAFTHYFLFRAGQFVHQRLRVVDVSQRFQDGGRIDRNGAGLFIGENAVEHQ